MNSVNLNGNNNPDSGKKTASVPVDTGYYDKNNGDFVLHTSKSMWRPTALRRVGPSTVTVTEAGENQNDIGYGGRVDQRSIIPALSESSCGREICFFLQSLVYLAGGGCFEEDFVVKTYIDVDVRF